MNKKLTKKRLLIYLAFSFALVWVPMIIYFATGGKYDSPMMNLILAYSMLCPSIAVLLTRKITKEGIPLLGKDSLQLGINLKNKKWLWFVLGFVAPVIYWDLAQLIFMAIFPETYNPAGFDVMGLPRNALILLPISGWTTGIVGSIGALGEEIGWRTYLYPKLEELMGPVGSVIVGGIIWGVWHYPAILQGHTFGTDYWGAPWSGFFVFTFSCVTMGALLYLVTKKTSSIWPAAIMHAVNNSGARALGLCLDTEVLTGIWAEKPIQIFMGDVVLNIMGVIAIVMLVKMKKEEE
ncbi:MAG: CPBP family intramembrane metalloprotease [Lachnospiraceae bacterium]|nr:CPBP family intramembrane metalloprotease [Lachnospiraceae bacterium]